MKPIKGKQESSLELKYCERCGGLWLRPVGGEQIYCTICSRAIAELPPSSREVRKARLPRNSRSEKEEEFGLYRSDGIEFDEAGGAE